jgi:hypothetical protein
MEGSPFIKWALSRMLMSPQGAPAEGTLLVKASAAVTDADPVGHDRAFWKTRPLPASK